MRPPARTRASTIKPALRECGAVACTARTRPSCACHPVSPLARLRHSCPRAPAGFFTKSVVVCVTNMWHLKDPSDLTRWPFYILLLGLPCEEAEKQAAGARRRWPPCCAPRVPAHMCLTSLSITARRAGSLVLQLRYLNSGLRRFDAMEMVPPYQSSIVTIGVAFGWIYFE